jgi:hypothetical protein
MDSHEVSRSLQKKIKKDSLPGIEFALHKAACCGKCPRWKEIESGWLFRLFTRSVIYFDSCRSPGGKRRVKKRGCVAWKSRDSKLPLSHDIDQLVLSKLVFAYNLQHCMRSAPLEVRLTVRLCYDLGRYNAEQDKWPMAIHTTVNRSEATENRLTQVTPEMHFCMKVALA